jgi:hypothetical protein
MPSNFLFAASLLLAVPAQDHGSGWQLQPADATHGAVLTLGAGDPLSYRFECGTEDVIITETGVTELMDLKTGKPVGDGPDAQMTPGAALLALFAGKGDPKFMPAAAVKNPAGGWDLTLHLPKGDKQLKAVGQSDMMSLFSTGQTMAVQMDASARATWNAFLRGCPAA